MSRADAGRIIHIGKKRERAKEDIENQRLKLEEERKNLAAAISEKFTTNVDKQEEKLKASTVGLVTLDEMKEKQQEILLQNELQITPKTDKKEDVPEIAVKSKTVAQKRILSFNFGDGDDDEEDEPPIQIKKRVGMNPDVDTSFLPDSQREQLLTMEKEKLAFCYWDGSSHRKDAKIKKGATISQFLQKALEILRKEFCELRISVTENLMFVKEDLIIPHFYTFQDFIATKAMGKTGPLYQFDAVGEIRVRQDAALDIGEAHPVKIVLRSWYEKNKHIYPASRWEPFVPNKEYKNTIDDLSTI
uniref:Protein FAM50 homolog n=1 Tax=Ditylenchus dipsaci TaxID=166011 RepID=A0A915EGQ2_9BILA